MKDLGTYYVKVRFEDGSGFIMEWSTCGRWTLGRSEISPLHANWISPPYEDDDDVISGIVYMFTDGNYSCDCNKRDFLAHAHQRDLLEDHQNPCGDTIKIRSLSVLRPNSEGWEELL